MKKVLAISISTNIGLMILALSLIQPVRTGEISPPHRNPPGLVAKQSPTPALEAGAFQWSRIEAADYRTYIANLRAVGCPQQTIRDIIVADVHSLYARRRSELEKIQPDTSDVSGNTTEAKLREEEAEVVLALLGPEDTREKTNAGLAARTDFVRASDRLVLTPLVFQRIDGAARKLNQRQMDVLGELRELFQKEISGLDQDPNTPGYRRRWQAAQRENDDLLAGLLGGQFFLDYQMEAANALQPGG